MRHLYVIFASFRIFEFFIVFKKSINLMEYQYDIFGSRGEI